MTYDTVATLSQVISLLLFIGHVPGRARLRAVARQRAALRGGAARALDLDRSHGHEKGAQ